MAQIYLEKDELSLQFNFALPLGETDNFDRRIRELSLNPTVSRKRIAEKSQLLIMKGHTEGVYELLTEDGIIVFAPDDKTATSLTAITYKPIQPSNINQFIRHGVKVYCPNGIIIRQHPNISEQHEMITYQDAVNYFAENGQTFLTSLDDWLNREIQITAIEERKNRKFNRLLDNTEQIIHIEDTIDRLNTTGLGSIRILQIHTLEQFQRLHKIAYGFTVIPHEGIDLELEKRFSITLEGAPPYEGTITKSEPSGAYHYIEMLFNRVIPIDQLQQFAELRPDYNETQKKVRLAAVEQIRSESALSSYMYDVFGLQQFAPMDDIAQEDIQALLSVANLRANDSQLLAIERGIATNDVLLVQGPPGTGKTTVILAWVKYFVQKGLRVLISSQNNKAVDNVLERLTEDPHIEMIRIGQENKVQSNVSHLLFEKKSKKLQQTIIETYGHITILAKETLAQLQLYAKDFAHFVDKAEMYELKASILQKGNIRAFKLMRSVIEQQKLLNKQETHQQTLVAKEALAIQSMKKHQKLPTAAKIIRLPQFMRLKLKQKMIQQQLQRFNHNIHDLQTLLNTSKTDVIQFRDQILNPTEKLVYRAVKEWESAFEKIRYFETLHLTGKPLVYKMDHITKETYIADIKQQFNMIQKMLEDLTKIEIALNDWQQILAEKMNYALAKVIIEGVDVVGATCVGINTQRRFEELDFDVVIIDEAGQIQIHNALVPLSRGKKMIMLGDHKQIPPIVKEEVLAEALNAGVNRELIENSLFEHLFYAFPESHKVLLDTQYRMPAEIADLLSEFFYEGRYKSFEGKMDMPSIFPDLFSKPFVYIDTSESVNRYETSLPVGKENQLEADLIVELVGYALQYIESDDNLTLHDIGIISAYKNQVELIKQKITAKFPHLKSKVNDIVASLDSYQGQERKVIIYSFTRSNQRAPERRRIGFLSELRRLNVALSRCQKQLIVIGDDSFLRHCEHPDEKQFSDFIRLLGDWCDKGKTEKIDIATLRNRFLVGEMS